MEPRIEDWLADLGLADYALRFKEADIDPDVLPHLTDRDLVHLGVRSLGHRRKILANAKLTSTPKALAERRFLTVLFCDIVGSTGLSEKLGAETYTELLDLYHSAVERVTKQYGGHVAQFLGDGALIYFGSPVPLEDASARAALTAHKMPSAIENLRDDLPKVAIRMGIASGLVVISSTSQGDRTAVGHTLNLAARLQSVAKPGTAVLSEASASLIRSQFNVKELGTHNLKGIDKPELVYQLENPKVSLERADVFRPATDGIFVNRASEQKALHAVRQSARAGGGAALLTGETGVGKSHLISEFITGFQSADMIVRSFHCSPLGANIPFSPFRRPLIIAAQEGNEDAAWLVDRFNNTDLGNSLERKQQRQQTIDALIDYLERGYEKSELVIVLEDLQWADPSSIETISQQAQRPRDRRLILLTSHNAEPLKQLPQVHHLAVKTLSKKHISEIICNTLTPGDGSDNLIARLADRADGMPMFAAELANEVRHRKNADRLTDGEIPSSLQQSLQARIDRLGSGRALLKLAASFAKICPIHLLRSLWKETTSFDDALSDLTQSGMARLLVGSSSEPEGLLEIKHQMVKECAYEMILKKNRRAVHDAIVKAISEKIGCQMAPAILAEQLELAEHIDQAAIKWAEAGTTAANQSADAEAVTLFKRALSLLPRMEPGQQREEFEIETVLKLYPTLIGAKGYVEASRELSERLKGLIAKKTKPELIMSGLFYQWISLSSQGDVIPAYELLTEIARDPVTGNDEVLELLWDRMLGSSQMFIGELEQARKTLQSFVERYDPNRHQEELSKFGATDNYITVLSCLEALDALENLPGNYNEIVAAAEKLGHTHTLCHTLIFGVGLPAVIRGDWDVARNVADRLKTISSDLDLSIWGLFANILESICMANSGDVHDAKALFFKAQASILAQGLNFMMPTFQAILFGELSCKKQVEDLDFRTLEKLLVSGERWMVPLIQKLD